MKQINKMTFDLTSEKGIKDLKALIEFLSLNSLNEEYCYNDIHISYIDGGFAKVEWTDVLKSGEDDCEWVFRNYDQLLVKQVNFPDGHYGYAMDADHEKELWEDWKKEHPEWYEEDSIMGKRWVNKMEKYEDYPDDFVRIIKEHPDCSFGHIKEPNYDAEWEKTQKQIIEEEKKEEEKKSEPIPAIEEAEIIPPEGWEPQEDGENPMLDEIFDEDEKKALEELEDERREAAQQEDSSMCARHDQHY